jgi:hypothetical protein
VTKTKHPAKFSDAILERVDALLSERDATDTPLVLDPFAGVGKIHQLTDIRAVGVEIEPEWATLHPDTIVANTLYLPFRDAVFDGMITSPTYGNRHCLTGDTLVLTAERGHIPIAVVEQGMHVLTHTGAWQSVLWSGRTGFMPIVELRGQVASRLRCTADHRLYVRQQAGIAPLRLSDECWMPAQECERRYWLTPASAAKPFDRPEAPFEESPDLWWAIGFWLANGSSYLDGDGRHATVNWCKDRRHAEHAERRLRQAFGDAIRPIATPGRNCNMWHLYRKEFALWLRSTFGRYAHTKTVPGWVLALPADSRQALVDGWLDGDGCPTGRDGERIGGSASLALIRGMQSLAHSVGWSTGMHQAKTAGVEMVVGKSCQVRDGWQLKVTTRKTKRTHHQAGLDATQITGVVPAGFADVYDLVIEDDHSFVANGVIVHNSDHHNARDGSVRHSYTHTLGRTLHTDNSGTLHWGDTYRAFHDAAWTECLRVLRPDAFVMINVSNHIRNGVEQPVVEWHLTWFLLHHCVFVELEHIKTRRLRAGANHQVRSPHEYLLHFRYQPRGAAA